ncbi:MULTISPECIES: sulfotransferase family 2 domain-containing protein [Bacillus cereus group]|uniref:sulfotransferase family 2 domain-containing protein n=1 Tax=Bacillus cereus group TaxID=86661 RepID=UPI000301F7A4|nr:MULTISPECIES: sulfotransferase family 2 domain-containing protein [Bacillus cereus group]MBJ7946276.1 sulfotransferase family 2 domain-containing protein [Bacillus cereus group sp. N24]OSM13902.1 RNA methyltransferase [Bacillus toyonensis]UFH99732.1 sulfotransferase family protein [Bacillus toyonensis]UKS62275.1 sulfotransferase family protein [Bacillus toyonensis]
MLITNIYDFIAKYGRPPHFHKDFPLILFWSQKSGCTSLAYWFFYHINLFKEVVKYSPFVHNYEFEIYKNSIPYFTDLANALQAKEKDTYKLVRNPFKRAVSSFISLIPAPYYESTEWKPIRRYLYGDESCNKKISFKLYLYYLKAHAPNFEGVNPHFTPQYIQGEEEFVTNHIYLENLSAHLSALEDKHCFKKSPLNGLINSWHHQSNLANYKGNYADGDITDPLFPRHPTYDSFYDEETIQLVKDIFKEDFTTYKYPSTLL